MTQKFNSRVSAEGALLIADAVAKNTKMSFLKAYGSTTEFSDDQLAGLTDKDLTGASHNQTGHISNVAVDDATSTVHTEIVLDGNSVEADYGLNSILIVATVDGNEHLFAVLKANQVQYMNAYDGKSSTNLQINCSFKVSNTDVVDIIKVDTAGTLTRADYDKLHEFTVSQVAVTVTNVNKYTDTAMSKEAAARSAADSAENKARSDADTWETGQRTAADTTETNARIAADNTAASSVSKLTSTVAANYTSATVYADSAVAAEATARSNAISSEAAARAAADVNLQKSVAANSSAIGVLRTSAAGYTDDKVASAATVASNSISDEAKARSTADSNEVATRSSAIVAEAKARSDGDSSEANARSAADKTLTDSITKLAGQVTSTISAVQGGGINLLTGTSSELKSATVPAGKEDVGQKATNGFQYAVSAGETYTYQIYVGKENPVDAYVLIGSYDENKNWYDIIGQGNTVLANTGGVSKVTFTIPNEVRYINLTPLGFSAQSTDITVYWKEEKLEKGSVATDHSPAPEDKADDNAVVHNSGDETVAGIKNFTGTLQANGKQVATVDQINPWHIINDAGRNLNNVIDDGRYWLGGIMTNSPVSHFGYLYVNTVNLTRVQQEFVDDTEGNMYIRVRTGTTWSEWKQVTFW